MRHYITGTVWLVGRYAENHMEVFLWIFRNYEDAKNGFKEAHELYGRSLDIERSCIPDKGRCDIFYTDGSRLTLREHYIY